MDQAITAFLITIAIVGGILSPILIIAFLGTVTSTMKAFAAVVIKAGEEVKKLPPFDDVEANLNPRTNVLQVRFYKNGKVLYQGSATRNDADLPLATDFKREDQ